MKPKQAGPMMEGSFEKARRAFFGDAKTSPEASASSAEFLQPRNEAASQEVTGASSGQSEAAVSLVLTPRELAGLIGQRGGVSRRR